MSSRIVTPFRWFIDLAVDVATFASRALREMHYTACNVQRDWRWYRGNRIVQRSWQRHASIGIELMFAQSELLRDEEAGRTHLALAQMREERNIVTKPDDELPAIRRARMAALKANVGETLDELFSAVPRDVPQGNPDDPHHVMAKAFGGT